MNENRKSACRLAIAAAFFLAAFLFGCGGGTSETPPPPDESDRPFALDATAAAPQVAQVVLFYAESLLTIGYQVGLWLETAPNTGGNSARCANGGQRTLRWSDVDRSGTLSAGDRIDISLDDCFAEAPAVSFTGNLVLTLLSSPTPGRLKAKVEISREGLLFVESQFEFRWRGALTIDQAPDIRNSDHSVQSDSSAPIELEFRSGDIAVVERIDDVNLWREVQARRAGIRSSLTMTLRSKLLQGKLALRTIEPLFSYFDTFPVEGVLQIFGTPSAVLEFTHSDGNDFVFIERVWQRTVEQSPWRSIWMGYLWWYSGDPPDAYSNAQRADATALHPVDGFDVSTSPEAREKIIQFSREIQADPNLVMKLARRASASGAFDWAEPEVSVSFEIDGAILKLAWSSQLQPGRDYDLQAFDRLTGAPRALRSIRGAGLSLHGMPIRFRVAASVSASIALGASPTVVAGTRLSLDGSASQSVAGGLTYLWEQTAGPALELSAATGPQTNVNVAQQEGVAPFDATIVLTVTSPSGIVDKARRIIRAVPSRLDAVLTRIESPPGDPVFKGRKGLYARPAGPANYGLYWEKGGPTDFLRVPLVLSADESAPVLWLAMPLGSPLEPGTFVAPVRMSERSPDVGAMELWGGSFIHCDQVNGVFTLTEMQFASHPAQLGTLITRLALDATMSCNQGPPFMLSFRYRSDIPITLP